MKDSYNCDALSIAGATAAIDDRAWFDRTRAAILATRERLTASSARARLHVRRLAGELRLVPARARPVAGPLPRLKADGVLVRYMNYAGWGDGLRITVGTDEQIDAAAGETGRNGLTTS